MSIFDKFLLQKNKKIDRKNPELFMECLKLVQNKPDILNTEIPPHLLEYLMIPDFDLLNSQEDPDITNLFFMAIELFDRRFFSNKMPPLSNIRLYGYFIQFQIFVQMAYFKHNCNTCKIKPVQIFNFMMYKNYALNDVKRLIEYYKELTEVGISH